MSQILKKGVFSSSLELVVVFRVDIFFFLATNLAWICLEDSLTPELSSFTKNSPNRLYSLVVAWTFLHATGPCEGIELGDFLLGHHQI